MLNITKKQEKEEKEKQEKLTKQKKEFGFASFVDINYSKLVSKLIQKINEVRKL